MHKLSIADLKAGIDYSQVLLDRARYSVDEADIQTFSKLKEEFELELEIKLRELSLIV